MLKTMTLVMAMMNDVSVDDANVDNGDDDYGFDDDDDDSLVLKMMMEMTQVESGIAHYIRKFER